MKADDVPVIDISRYETGDAQADRVIEQSVGDACENIGFLVLKGHGIPDALIERMRAVSNEFFDLSESQKMQSASDPGRTMGYVPHQKENLAATRESKTPPDLKEVFDIRRPDTSDDAYYTSEEGTYFFRPLTWPERPVEFKATWIEYYQAMEALAQKVMRIFAGALNMERGFFEDKMDRSVDYLRAINYPAQTEPPAPGQLRAGAHTDYGTLTLLLTSDAPGGLQVQGKDSSWIDVPHIRGTYVVNIGDMMSQWTNDRWVSTLHRVVNPDQGSTSQSRRLSIPFFQNPNYDTVIEPLPTCVPENDAPRYEPVMAGEWLRAKQTKQRVM